MVKGHTSRRHSALKRSENSIESQIRVKIYNAPPGLHLKNQSLKGSSARELWQELFGIMIYES